MNVTEVERKESTKQMEIMSRDIKDGRVLSLIHKYLRARAVWCGRFEDTEIGVPQGGPLSPLCANIMLNELVILCKSKASARQTLESFFSIL